jgi:hypothetical protein
MILKSGPCSFIIFREEFIRNHDFIFSRRPFDGHDFVKEFLPKMIFGPWAVYHRKNFFYHDFFAGGKGKNIGGYNK